MATGVLQTIQQILAQEGRMSLVEAGDAISELRVRRAGCNREGTAVAQPYRVCGGGALLSQGPNCICFSTPLAGPKPLPRGHLRPDLPHAGSGIAHPKSLLLQARSEKLPRDGTLSPSVPYVPSFLRTPH